MSYEDQFPLLKVLFQPVCLSDGQLVFGYEAFISDSAKTNASTLYELAAKHNRVRLLEKLTFSKICREFSSHEFGGKLFVNIFSESLTTGSLQSEILLNILHKNNINPSHVIIELVEFAPIKNINSLLAVIKKLRHEGIHIALDGFGFGYSNLGRLLEIDPQFIKIDARFYIKQSDERRAAVFASLVQLCSVLNVCVIAKNVENIEIANTVRSEIGVCLFQGDYFGRPNDVNGDVPAPKNRYAYIYRELLTPALSTFLSQEK